MISPFSNTHTETKPTTDPTQPNHTHTMLPLRYPLCCLALAAILHVHIRTNTSILAIMYTHVYICHSAHSRMYTHVYAHTHKHARHIYVYTHDVYTP
jgi:hypothetical protein